jgi:hypothetical protein
LCMYVSMYLRVVMFVSSSVTEHSLVPAFLYRNPRKYLQLIFSYPVKKWQKVTDLSSV